jgi:transposase
VGLVDGPFVALERVGEILADPYGVRPSDGTIQGWVIQAATALEPAYAAWVPAIQPAEVVHFDESGVRQSSQLHWLHVAATASQVHSSGHAQRGGKGLEAAGILPALTGITVHDHWKPYRQFRNGDHSLCNAHHLRELRYFEETTGHYGPTGLIDVRVAGQDAVRQAQRRF